MTETVAYSPRRIARSQFVEVRGLRYHLLRWGDPALVTAERPPLLLLHGWMDVGASFQFIVDALARDRLVLAPDWRGFGLTETPAGDCYWFPDYLGDLDRLLDAVLTGELAGRPIDLLGHSMGGNVAMLYAGIRPARIRRLINLEGFGLPATRPVQAPRHYARWLDELKTPAELRRYPSLAAVAARLQKTNPLLPADRAAWLARHWARPRVDADGHEAWEILGDPAHKRSNPLLYQVGETLECWKLITAPLLWVEGDRTDIAQWWGNRYTKEEFHRRLDVVARVERQVLAPAGHMLHHDQPAALAQRLEAFLDAG